MILDVRRPEPVRHAHGVESIEVIAFVNRIVDGLADRVPLGRGPSAESTRLVVGRRHIEGLD